MYKLRYALWKEVMSTDFLLNTVFEYKVFL
jgi:hypothetical protein